MVHYSLRIKTGCQQVIYLLFAWGENPTSKQKMLVIMVSLLNLTTWVKLLGKAAVEVSVLPTRCVHVFSSNINSLKKRKKLQLCSSSCSCESLNSLAFTYIQFLLNLLLMSPSDLNVWTGKLTSWEDGSWLVRIFLSMYFIIGSHVFY